MTATDAFSLHGRAAVVTGGYGVLGSAIAAGLASAGARVAVLGRRADAANAVVERIRATGADACAVIADVLDDCAVRDARDRLLRRGSASTSWSTPRAATSPRAQRQPSHLRSADGRVRRSAAPQPARQRHSVAGVRRGDGARGAAAIGSIVTISSMAAMQALSGVLGYSVAKAGVDNFTRWMAVELARQNGAGVRVNAIAPGFFVTEQNREVLVQPDGHLHRPRAHHHRPHADGTVRPSRGAGGRRSVAVQRRRVVRHRHGDSGRRRVQRVQRCLRATQRLTGETFQSWKWWMEMVIPFSIAISFSARPCRYRKIGIHKMNLCHWGRMKITDIRATPVTVPLEAPLRHANGCHWGRFVRTIVEVETDEGHDRPGRDGRRRRERGRGRSTA